MSLFEQWVPQSPERIRSKSFSAPRFGRRGYAIEEVDQYLARLAEEAGRSAVTIGELRAEVDRLKDWIREHSSSGATNSGNSASGRSAGLPRGSVEREAITLLTRAQHQADQLVAAAREQAQRLVYDARGQRDEIVTSAREEAERAARAYRDRAGATYSADTEAQHRQLAWLRTVSAALGSVRAQLPAVAEQVEAISGLFAHEMRNLQDELGTEPVPPGNTVPRADPTPAWRD